MTKEYCMKTKSLESPKRWLGLSLEQWKRTLWRTASSISFIVSVSVFAEFFIDLIGSGGQKWPLLVWGFVATALTGFWALRHYRRFFTDRAPTGLTTDGSPPPSAGLIYAVSTSPSDEDAVERFTIACGPHLKEKTLAHVWLIYTEDSKTHLTALQSKWELWLTEEKLASGLQSHKHCASSKLHLLDKVPADKLYDPVHYFYKVKAAFGLARALGIRERELICDTTGLFSQYSIGAALACLQRERLIQYSPMRVEKQIDGTVIRTTLPPIALEFTHDDVELSEWQPPSTSPDS
jgi:hypothetical protein